MIAVTRLNGTELWINPLLIETLECTPDSVVTLTNGHRYVVRETPREIVDRFQRFLRGTASDAAVVQARGAQAYALTDEIKG